MPINIFNTFDDPSASTGTTQATGVNGMDQIVGFYQNGTGHHGFLLSGGMYTTLDDPSATFGTFASVFPVAKGSSSRVVVPPLRRNPCDGGKGLRACPTIWPASLMPIAWVKAA